MCKCGCNTCETIRGPLLTEGRVKKLISENLSYHIDNNISLMENVFRIGSDAHLSMIKEAKKLYSRGVLDLCEEDEALMETHLGEFDLYENEIVPLDLPMLEEQMDIEDEIANEEFGMDYDQLGSNEKEWVRDEIDNMEMRESKYHKEETIQQTIDRLKARIDDPNDGGNVPFLVQKIKDLEKSLNEDLSKMPTQDQVDKFFALTQNEIHYLNSKPVAGQEKTFNKMEVEPWDEYDLSNFNSLVRKAKSKGQLKEAKQDIYDKFLDNPSSPKGRAKSLILKFTKEYGDNASSMAVDRFAKQNNLKPEEKYILKYITKNDIKISSQSGGPDFSVVSEAEFKGKEVSLGKPKRGGPKAYYVYVKDGDKVKKVTFGSGGLRAKIKNKEARNAFAARHNCKNKKDRTKAGYWSCNLPRYASQLGLGANMNTFW